MKSSNPNTGYPTGAQLGTELADAIKKRFPTSTCTHHHSIPPRPATYDQWPDWVNPALRNALIDAGIHYPYAHQSACANATRKGLNVIIATGTSSGKSLGYQLPILTRLAENHTACALYLTPTKALGSDQLLSVSRLIAAADDKDLSSIAPAPYDGDTPPEARSGIRDHSRFIFTNPDMIHTGILPNHQRWAKVLRHLEFIVIDECHTYRGIFGAHIALVLRRLLRIAAHYNAHPTIILASATSHNPSEHARQLIGDDVIAVTEDTAPLGARTVLLWEPGFLEQPVRRAASSEAAGIMATLIGEGARTLTFVRSRRQAEITALRCAEELTLSGRKDLAHRVAAYRAGYLAEERRQLEQALDDGTLLGVATTNALELGIDVGGLDAVITAGFPGTIASFWQQAGRAGRRGQGSLVVLVARDEPMDNYLIHHPEAIFGRPIEKVVVNPHNPHILYGHMLCACVEKPLSDTEVQTLAATEVMQQLASEKLVRKRNGHWFANPLLTDPHAQVALRGTGKEFNIVDASDGRMLGTVDAAQAFQQIHPGAVYIHQGESFLVEELDLENLIALVQPALPDFSTYARSTTDIHILNPPEAVFNPASGVWVANVDVEVTNQVTGYVRTAADGSILDTISLDLPAMNLTTRAVAYTIDPLILDQLGIDDTPGALHAAEHAAIGILPLVATCDRWDIGGVSTTRHEDTGLPTVFVYDGHPGGAGFADCGYERFATWIQMTYEVVRDCPCASGCPMCVQSPKCGNGNSPLSKQGALALLGALTSLLAHKS
ncbi:DEAD/DEAH box helicase [Corynebacterium kutscheri]|uniref:DEAD/DEAH box helicase n=1 Tax=Corynebacterium kutscheri TaxID=35755 RepID=UPI000F718834|nr:DEAD/DEAH box helicase [Corynebacterium kutscheri]VEH80697.1 DEAD/DEAH box helicase [Corynebacterium kutscheri]